MKRSRRRVVLTLAVVALALAPSLAWATTITLAEWALNIDDVVTDCLPPACGWPSGVDGTAFDQASGLGKVTVTVSGAGSHKVRFFVDHEINEATNGFSDEFGDVVGALPSGLSWEIDEPGWSFGDIFTNFSAGALDGVNGVPSGSPEDASMALGWDFSLNAVQTATVTFDLTTGVPASGFYLAQTDGGQTDPSVYYRSGLGIEGGSAVPEPATTTLMGLALAALAAATARKRTGSR